MKIVRKYIGSGSSYRIFYLLFFALLACGQLQRFQITESIAFYGHELILLIWILLFSQSLISQLYIPLFKRILSVKAALILVIFLFLQVTVHNLIDFQLTQLLYLARFSIYGSLLGVLVIGLRSGWITKATLYATILGIGTCLSLSGLLQYLLLPDTRFLWYLGWDDHYYRLISTLFDPNFTALIIGTSLLFYLTTDNAKKVDVSYAHFFHPLFIIPFFLLSILLTYSRSGYLALSVGLVSLAYIRKQVHPLLILLILLLSLPFLPRPAGEGVKLERTASIESRIDSNRQTIQSLSLTEVVFGQGFYRHLQPNSNGIPQHSSAPDNSVIFLVSSLGIIGSGLLLTVIIRLLNKKSLAPGSLPILIAIITHSVFNNSLFYIWTISISILILIYFHSEDYTPHN